MGRGRGWYFWFFLLKEVIFGEGSVGKRYFPPMWEDSFNYLVMVNGVFNRDLLFACNLFNSLQKSNCFFYEILTLYPMKDVLILRLF